MKNPKQRHLLGLQRISAIVWDLISSGLFEEQDGSCDEEAVKEVKVGLLWLDDAIEEAERKAAKKKRKR